MTTTNQLIRAIAIDDEPIALDILKSHAAGVPFLTLKACFVSVKAAILYLKTNQIDLVFLDIHMPDQSGLVIAAELDPSIQFIFTTAYSEYAVQGFELAATDYLLKPIKPERFLSACNRVLIQFTARNTIEQSAYIFIKSGYDLVRVDLNKLLFIRAADNYVIIYEASQQIISRITLTAILENLPKKDFIRVHKSYIVAIQQVHKVEPNKLFIASYEIPISKAYKDVINSTF